MAGGWSALAARSYQLQARSYSFGTPLPSSYSAPALYMASAKPPAAAFFVEAASFRQIAWSSEALDKVCTEIVRCRDMPERVRARILLACLDVLVGRGVGAAKLKHEAAAGGRRLQGCLAGGHGGFGIDVLRSHSLHARRPRAVQWACRQPVARADGALRPLRERRRCSGYSDRHEDERQAHVSLPPVGAPGPRSSKAKPPRRPVE